jgi:hypothetical protein
MYDSLVDHMGRALADRIVRDRGGTTFRVPNQPAPWLVGWLGETDAARLCQQFGNETLVVPRNLAQALAARNARVRDEAHLPRNVLARKYELTDRHIRRILNDSPAPDFDDRQGTLL